MASETVKQELDHYLELHPETRFLEPLMPDINGILRGKRLGVDDFDKAFVNGLNFCGAATLMDSQGKIFEKSKPELVFDYRQTNIGAKFILSANLKLFEGDPDQILRTVKEVWIYKENNQPPLNTKNSGCIFKNPRGVSAGVLIDRAGLKGLRVGGAVVSEKHANFILAEKDCTSHDILRLINVIKDKVREQLDTELELEIEVW